MLSIGTYEICFDGRPVLRQTITIARFAQSMVNVVRSGRRLTAEVGPPRSQEPGP